MKRTAHHALPSPTIDDTTRHTDKGDPSPVAARLQEAVRLAHAVCSEVGDAHGLREGQKPWPVQATMFVCCVRARVQRQQEKC